MGSFPHSQVEHKHSVLCHGKKILIHDCKDQAKLEDSGEVFEWSAAKKVLETTYTHRDGTFFLHKKKLTMKFSYILSERWKPIAYKPCCQNPLVNLRN